ncbi:GAF domain-containing protein [Devosia sp. SL43]|uniref:GAF domain-containing protein n=1 Tax=Devosia sp. SL43 TaxID=2806348 RepID=UPI001F2C6C13|nr:GAF domain-containing protein [Devosia sp. SL43]UJW85629.1 GAF domain-containing protein [Devosia sp. SL43]
MSAAFRTFEECLARYADPLETGRALHDLAASMISSRLFTLTAINMAAMQVRRVYSSHPDVYPLLGTKPIVLDDWFEAMRTERRITAINTSAGMEGQFPDLALIRSLGCNSSLSIPIMTGNELLGTINVLDAEGSYPADVVEKAADLIIPATAVFLILRGHFAL